MSAPSSLIQAALQRLGARIGSGLLDAVASLAVLAQDAPDKLRQELQLFWEEVEAEADRIDRGDTAPAGEWTSPGQGPTGQGPTGETASGHGGPDSPDPDPYSAQGSQAGAQPVASLADPQRQIDNLRALIASLARRLDQQLDQQRMGQQRLDKR